jgi:RND family efflux transporter MFP subunit
MVFSRGTLTAVTVVIVVSIMAAGIYWRLRPEDEGQDAQTPSEGSGEALDVSASQQFATDVPQPVEGVEVVRDTLWITVTAAGQAEAYRRTTLTSRVDGIISQISARENDRVAAGQLLLQFDTVEFALAVARAEADLRNAQAVFEERMLSDDPREDPEVRRERERLARARSGLDQSEVTLRERQLELERATVGAPFPGRIANMEVVEGQHMSPGGELMTVVDLDPIKVEVQVLEAEVGYLLEGRRASITFAAFSGETFNGRIETINPVVDPDTRTARVTVILRNPDGRIKPGMYARTSLEAQNFPDRILVPRTAILERDSRTMLFVLEDGRAKWRYVTPGLESGTLVEIVASEETSMVESGEIVLTDGHFYLVHDAPVRLVESVAAEERGGVR